MNRYAFTLIITIIGMFFPATYGMIGHLDAQPTTRLSFNEGWTCNGAAVTLPHDAMLAGSRSADAASGGANAFFRGGHYVYEKHFENPGTPTVLFQFEGVYKNATVKINGHAAGGCAYGFLPFFVDAAPYLVRGDNVITVECDNSAQPDSRWYSGAGVYRPVWMYTGGDHPILPETVKISTLSCDPPRIKVSCPRPLTVEIYDGQSLLASGYGKMIELSLSGAALWSEERPKLYTCKAYDEDDVTVETFGIRTIEWSAEGLMINGKKTLLRGGCLHADNGIVGAATYDELEYRRVALMKTAGFNAIRSSHNPASRALIEACDALGMYLIDEAWDMWYHAKTEHDYAGQWKDHYMADLSAIARRDYNHPSVLMYSIGNELTEPCDEEGLAYADRMIALLHETDPSRPVTAGVNLMILASASKGKGGAKATDKSFSGISSTLFNMMTQLVGTGMNKAANGKKADTATSPFLDRLDIAGYNYASGRYPKEGKAHPERVIFGSETFPQDIVKNWKMVQEYPWLVGDFMWTAIDYLGEVGLGSWTWTSDGKGFNKPYPWLLAEAGVMDILGNPTGELFQAAAVWGKLDSPVICVRPLGHKGKKPAKAVWRGTNSIPSWSWKGCEGEKATVEVYVCGAARIELILNGKRIGRKKVKDGKAIFRVKYAPGTLTAIAYDRDGKQTDTVALTSAGEASVSIDAPVNAFHGDILFIPISLVDKDGNIESNDERIVTVTVEGGDLLAFGSANPKSEERFISGTYTTHYGKAAAVIRVGSGAQTVIRASTNDKVNVSYITVEH